MGTARSQGYPGLYSSVPKSEGTRQVQEGHEETRDPSTLGERGFNKTLQRNPRLRYKGGSCKTNKK